MREVTAHDDGPGHAAPAAASIRVRGAGGGHNGRMIDALIARMAAMLEPLQADGDQRRYFHATYQRTTIAVAGELKRGGFADAEWVERWDVAFADLYLEALEASLAGQVVVGKALATDPRILIIDQPTAGVDVGTKAQLHHVLRALANSGAALLVVSDDLDE